jgi:hypothetical protein
LRKEFIKMQQENRPVSTGFITEKTQNFQTPSSPINIQDTEIFSGSPPPPVSLQAGNLEVLTKLTDPSKILLRPQNPKQNPKELYVTVIKKRNDNTQVLGVIDLILFEFSE